MMKHPSVLVVDDEPNNFDVIETLLDINTGVTEPHQQCQLHYVASGPEAITSLDVIMPDLILLDVMMPYMDGIEVCQAIKAMPRWKPVPIIMVTALTRKEDLACCLESGADDFISKPVNALELNARVHSMLRIKQQYDDLQGLLKLREDMVNMVIHDLRNPLTGILLGVETLKIPNYPPERYLHKVTQISSAAEMLQLLVDDLLKISLLESGKLCLKSSKTDLCALANSVTTNFEPIAAQKKQTIKLYLPQERGKAIAIDANMIHRTLDNLLSNAIKFSPENSQIIVNVELPTSTDYRIQVIDAGPGVPEKLKQTIFEKYEIGNQTLDVPQLGLGLAFCKMIVEAHGGHICIKDNEPQGSIFELTLHG